jgi:urease accessory protein
MTGVCKTPWPEMSWLGHLNLDYRREGDRTIALDRHEGPLRVLQRLYPEGPGICHHVLVHPPGGIVGGDVLALQAQLATGTHALITTPGATRFYRSSGPEAVQSVIAQIAEGARLEWLPLEAIAYRGSIATNRMRFELAPGAEMMGWDVLALGLPAANEPFEGAQQQHSRYTQEIELPGTWLERGTVHATDTALLDSPLGWAGNRVMGTMWFASGLPLQRTRKDALLDAARATQAAHPLSATSGCTSVVLRVLAPHVEIAMNLMTRVWAQWRQLAWDVPAVAPRIWRT